MNIGLILAFLFFMGSTFGWSLELFFRRFISAANPERKWINPGFCIGPYLPIYGFGLCVLFLTASLEPMRFIAHPVWNRVVLFAAMAVFMTAIEYIAGVLALRCLHVRLWDYRKERGNFQGIICPKFSGIWALLGALYYFLIHSRVQAALIWLSQNLAFSFFIGLFYGFFIIDVVYSARLIHKIKQFADENQVVIRFEHVKSEIRRLYDQSAARRYRFFFPMETDRPLSEYLQTWATSFESRRRSRRSGRN